MTTHHDYCLERGRGRLRGFLELRRDSRVTTGISAFPLGWPWARGFHTQLDEGPETPRATREASGVPFLRQDEA